MPGELTHGVLTQIRDRLPPADPLQQAIAPLEHRAYARESTAENPLMALALAAGIPVWQLAKAFGLPARTGPAMDQVWGGYTGILEGLGTAAEGALRRQGARPEAPGILAATGGIGR